MKFVRGGACERCTAHGSCECTNAMPYQFTDLAASFINRNHISSSNFLFLKRFDHFGPKVIHSLHFLVKDMQSYVNQKKIILKKIQISYLN